MHFIINDCKDEQDILGKIKLNKILYFADMIHFLLPKIDFENKTPFSSNRVSEEEKALLREVIAFVCRDSAKVISELSHNAAWEARRVGDEISYESAYGMKPVEITERDVA